MRKFESIATLIRNKRKSLKLSQTDVSYSLGYKGKGQYFSNIERGKCSIPKKDINKLAEVLKIDKDEIIQAMVEDYMRELYEASEVVNG